MTIRKQFIVIGLMFIALALALSGCASKPAVKKRDTGLSEAILSGKVAETMDAGEYTYVLLDKDGTKTWAALPVTKLTVGQDVKILGGAVMPQFYSTVLDRTFEKVVFSGGLYQEKTATANPAPAAEAPKQDPTAPFEQPVLAGKVIETMEGGSYTYVQLEKDGKKSWSAMPTALNPVKLGDEIELIRGIDMGVFKSPQLNRTFESIHFSAGIKGLQERREKFIAANEAATKAAQEKAAAKQAQADAAKPAEKAADKAAETAASPLPQGHPTIDAAALKEAQDKAAAASVQQGVTGKVVETMNAGGYTYLLLEQKGGEKIWAAVPAMETKLGEELTLPPGNTMTAFTSKSLNRTFEKIIFTGPPVQKK